MNPTSTPPSLSHLYAFPTPPPPSPPQYYDGLREHLQKEIARDTYGTQTHIKYGEVYVEARSFRRPLRALVGERRQADSAAGDASGDGVGGGQGGGGDGAVGDVSGSGVLRLDAHGHTTLDAVGCTYGVELRFDAAKAHESFVEMGEELNVARWVRAQTLLEGKVSRHGRV